MQTDLDQMFLVLSLGAKNLGEIVARAEAGSDLARDLEKALDLVRAASRIVQKYADTDRIPVSKDPFP